jgi:hypothetical protein
MKRTQCEFEIDHETRTITFINPFRTKTREGKTAYRDHVRVIKPSAGNLFEIAEQLRLGVFKKMEAAHENAKTTTKKKSAKKSTLTDFVE